MARDIYKWPIPLDQSFLDQDISLSSSKFALKAYPVKVLLFYIGMFLFILWSVTQTFISKGSWWTTTLYIILMILVTFVMGKYSKTKEMRFMQIPALLSYLPKDARRVMTRNISHPAPFYQIVGIKDITEEGLIKFTDGTFGKFYLVVGTASILLFDQDRADIIDRNDSFWRKVNYDSEFIFMTTKEPQRVYKQIAHTKDLFDNLAVKDPDLMNLLDERFYALSEGVGKRFKSIHQYLMIKAESFESLQQSENVVASEDRHSKKMFKSVTVLNRGEILDSLSVIYQGTDRE